MITAKETTLDFLGLDATAWTAIATIALVVVTMAYVIVTGYLARQASKSAASAQTSAQGALRAAQAAERATNLAEAGLNIDFEASYDEVGVDAVLFLICLGSRVSVERVVLGGMVYPEGAGREAIPEGELDWRAPSEGPERVHKGEQVMFGWPTAKLDLTQQNVAFVRIWFRIAKEDESSGIDRPVQFPREPGQYF